MQYTVRFVNQNKIVTVEGGTLAGACEKAGYPLNLVCGGRGVCGKCRVTVKRNGTLEEVLACREMIRMDEEVYLEEKDYLHESSVLTESQLSGVRFSPSVKKVYRTKEELMPESGKAFLSGVSVPVMRKFAKFSAAPDFEGCTFVYYGDRIIDVQEGDRTEVCFGAAVDIGTTTVVCYLYDLVNGRLIKAESGANRQITHGADVISRNMFAQERPDNLKEMQRLIRETVNELLDRALEMSEEENLYHVVLCGNSTMQHLFYGINPVNLGKSPFANITAKEILTSGREAGLHCASEGMVEFLPLLGGFVGADTTAVLLTLEEDDRKYLMVDLGTNGEIAVGNHHGFMVASTACGPALEGGNIACGMRGEKGAVESISLDDDQVTIQVIGDSAPRGLCGSAVVDAVAEMRKVGLIDDTGRLLSAQEYEKEHPGSPFCQRLREAGEYNMAFYFVEGEHPVYLCQKDIRQIQLAKSSICSGCLALLEEYGITADQVDTLVLAGAFGNYINVDHALSIGLLPPVARDKIISVGNGAGRGVQMVLLDSDSRRKLEKIPDICTHKELASDSRFMELYISNMNF